jgi:hypothetical protein
MNKLKDYPETSNVGKLWSKDDDLILQNHIHNKNINYDNIALELKRTSTGIRSRVFQKFIYPEYNNGIDIVELSDKYNINQDALEMYIKKEKDRIKISLPKVSKEDKLDKILELLSKKDRFEQISQLIIKEDKLDKILQLLNEINNKLN